MDSHNKTTIKKCVFIAAHKRQNTIEIQNGSRKATQNIILQPIEKGPVALLATGPIFAANIMTKGEELALTAFSRQSLMTGLFVNE